MKKLFAGIDTGTQGVRIGIVDEDGTVLTAHEKKWDTEYPAPGWAEQDPNVWWEKILETFSECCGDLNDRQRKALTACAVCATSSTAVVVDKDGTPMGNAMMWMDIRSKDIAEEINQGKYERLKYCGEEVSAEWLIPKVLWIKRERRELYDSCWKIIEQLDWINYKLSGNLAASICNTTCKWNYVLEEGGFSKGYFEKIGLEDYEDKLITNVIKIGQEVGCISGKLAEKFGINPEMKIVQGCIDAHMAMFGLNAIREKKLAVTMGTSFVHLCLVKDKPDIKGVWGPYDSAIIDNMWLLEGGQISASGLVNWFRKNFHIEGTKDNVYAKLMECVKDTDIGAEGLVVLDYFQGNRTPYKDSYSKGVIYGLTMKHTWKHIYRAILESVAFGTHNIVKNFEEQGCSIDVIVACGGVTKDRGWLQIISDVTGKPIVVTKESQAGVLGCCVVAAAGGRHYDTFEEAADVMVVEDSTIFPDMDAHWQYEEIFKKYLGLYKNLRTMMREDG